MTSDPVPAEVRALADSRAMARAGRDWPEADRLRSEIEAAGWKVVDRGFSYRLEQAFAPDVEIAGRIRYGRSESVPSRLGEPSTTDATVIVVATDDPDPVERTIAALRRTTPAGVQLVLVGDGPSAEVGLLLERLAEEAGGGRGATAEDAPEGGDTGGPGPADHAGGIPIEVVWTSHRLGRGAAVNAGVRRATGTVVVLLDAGLEPAGDVVTALVAALSDPTVAVAGAWGSVTPDLRVFEDAPAGDVDVVDGSCLAYRRADHVARGPLDERFRTQRHLGAWWGLTLRDEGPGATPRRALRVGALPLDRAAEPGTAPGVSGARDRAVRRDSYRLLDRFGPRSDLLTGDRRRDG